MSHESVQPTKRRVLNSTSHGWSGSPSPFSDLDDLLVRQCYCARHAELMEEALQGEHGTCEQFLNTARWQPWFGSDGVHVSMDSPYRQSPFDDEVVIGLDEAQPFLTVARLLRGHLIRAFYPG